MKLKQKERYIYDELSGLATSKIFLAVIVCEIITGCSSLFKLIFNDATPALSGNGIINLTLIFLSVLLNIAYCTILVLCYINIYSYFKGKAQSFFGLKHLYKVQLWGAMIITGCSLIFRLFNLSFDLLSLAIAFFYLSICLIIVFLIYSMLIRNTIECAEFASNRIIHRKIGNGIVIYAIISIISETYLLISSPIFRFFEYDSIMVWLKEALVNLTYITGLISLVLYFILLRKFQKAINIK